MVTQSQLKVDLKKIGCKLKSQMNGQWAICEPKGGRVIVGSLEEVHEYYLSKSAGSESTNSQEEDVTEVYPVISDEQINAVSEKVERQAASTQVKPVPDEVKQAIAAMKAKQAAAATQVQHVPDDIKRAAAATRVSPVPDKVQAHAQRSHQQPVDRSQIKVNLKKIGCKLKSQMNGQWAITEPKGNRVIVNSLEEVHQYYLIKTGAAQPRQVSRKPAPAEIDPNKTVEMPVQHSRPGITRSNRKITRSNPAIKSSAELSASIEKANHVINLLKERRLKMGINVTRTDLKTNLLAKVCSDALIDDVMRYVETKLDKDCLDRVLVKRNFKNHLGEDDVMYFDIRYAGILANND